MCKVSSAVIAADGQAVATACRAIAAALEATDPSAATALNAAATVLVAATANWQTGTPVTDINTAAAAIEAILAAIPLTAPYASFVAIAVAALDILLANLGTQATQGTSSFANARAVLAHVDTLPPNHWRGVAEISHDGNLRKGFEGTWNKAAAEYTGTPAFGQITV
jgi:hypothetical protein